MFDEGGGGYCVLMFVCSCSTRDRKKWATWEGDGTHEVLVSQSLMLGLVKVGIFFFPNYKRVRLMVGCLRDR